MLNGASERFLALCEIPNFMEFTEPLDFASLRKSENETRCVMEHDVFEGVLFLTRFVVACQ